MDWILIFLFAVMKRKQHNTETKPNVTDDKKVINRNKTRNILTNVLKRIIRIKVNSLMKTICRW